MIRPYQRFKVFNKSFKKILQRSLMVLLSGSLVHLGYATIAAENVQAQEQPDAWITAWVDDLKQSNQQWIGVDISDQTLTAWEGDTIVYSVSISTGRAEEPTPTGVFSIQEKHEKAWMQGENYEIPNVPYTMYYSGNYAIHGTYWHDSFGTPVSNGCVNVPIEQAAWLYNWASIGTPVIVEP